MSALKINLVKSFNTHYKTAIDNWNNNEMNDFVVNYNEMKKIIKLLLDSFKTKQDEEINNAIISFENKISHILNRGKIARFFAIAEWEECVDLIPDYTEFNWAVKKYILCIPCI